MQPKTHNGKLQSRRNAMRHGLTAATVVTAIDDAEEFERFEAVPGAIERLPGDLAIPAFG